MRATYSRRSLLLAGLRLGGAVAAADFAAPDLAAAGETRADLPGRARRLLGELPVPELQDFLALWPATAARRPTVAALVPVLRFLPAVRGAAPLFSASFVAALAAAAPTLTWRRTYTEAEVDAQLLENYGWTELVGLTGPVPSERLACGVLLLGPQVNYPPHHHEADEIYVPLSGTARWQHAGGDWELLLPGSVIHNLRNESHAMRTAAEPLLALYLWRSRDLQQKSQLDSAAAHS